MSILADIQERLIVIHLNTPDWKKAIEILGRKLVEQGCVREAYIPAVIEREKSYATGLPTKPVGVALPHADGKHVKETGIAVGVLRKPVAFQVMGNPDQTVDVAVVILIAMKEPEKQVQLLKELIGILRQSELLEKISSAPNSKDVYQILARDL